MTCYILLCRLCSVIFVIGKTSEREKSPVSAMSVECSGAGWVWLAVLSDYSQFILCSFFWIWGPWQRKRPKSRSCLSHYVYGLIASVCVCVALMSQHMSHTVCEEGKQVLHPGSYTNSSGLFLFPLVNSLTREHGLHPEAECITHLSHFGSWMFPNPP